MIAIPATKMAQCLAKWRKDPGALANQWLIDLGNLPRSLPTNRPEIEAVVQRYATNLEEGGQHGVRLKRIVVR